MEDGDVLDEKVLELAFLPLLPGELYKHGVKEGNRAVNKAKEGEWKISCLLM